MKLILSVSRLFIRIALICAIVGLPVIGFSLFEPVKAKRTLRQVKNQIEILFSDKRERQSSVKDYEPIVLHEARPLTTKPFSDSEEPPIRLMDMEFETNSPSSPRKVSVSLDGQQRSAITGVVPFDFSYNLRIPGDGYLWFGINGEVSGSSAGDLGFTIQVFSKNGTETLFEIRLSSNNTKWKDQVVDLSALAGQEVKIRFNIALEESKPNSTQKSVKAYWSDLYLGSRAKASNKPNIFLILIDTLRPDHLSCYGYERPTSPNIDKLAAEGVRFDRAFSASPWTNPSILALFTGLHPSDVWEPKPHEEAIKLAVPARIDTLAEILSANGYFTIAASDHPGINHRLFGQGFDIYTHLYYSDGPYVGWRETDTKKVLKQLHTILERRLEGGLFTYVHLIYPHQPYEPPAPYDDYFGRGALRYIPENKASMINMYDGEIKRTDDVIGDFLADIKRMNLDNDSIIILLSDHGEGFWEHGQWEHGNSLYNELLHIPLIFHAPGRIPENKTIYRLVRNVDILPTILELVDIQYDKKSYRGNSLLPLIRGNDDKSKRLAFSEFPHYTPIVFGRAIQSLEEKLIHPGRDGKPIEYFDITKDPTELNNLRIKESHRASDLMSIMNDISRTAKTSRTAHPMERVEPSEDTIKKLKSLGYVQ